MANGYYEANERVIRYRSLGRAKTKITWFATFEWVSRKSSLRSDPRSLSSLSRDHRQLLGTVKMTRLRGKSLFASLCVASLLLIRYVTEEANGEALERCRELLKNGRWRIFVANNDSLQRAVSRDGSAFEDCVSFEFIEALVVGVKRDISEIFLGTFPLSDM